ncbi:MAG: IclR family transcriptional regulator [Nitriliruptoraceae bacterium]
MGSEVQVPAAERTVAILRYLAARSGPVTAGEIGRELAIPRSSLYHLLTALEEHGLVAHLSPPGRYQLGIAAFELGSAYQRQTGLERAGRALVAGLVRQTGHTGHLGILDGTEVVYLVREDPPRRQPSAPDVGVRLPAHLTAAGRCLLAGRPLLPVETTYPHHTARVTRTDRGPLGLTGLRHQLVLDRRRGWSMEDGELTAGLTSIAAATRGRPTHRAAAIAVTFPSGQLDEAATNELAGQVVAAAGLLDARLDHSWQEQEQGQEQGQGQQQEPPP